MGGSGGNASIVQAVVGTVLIVVGVLTSWTGVGNMLIVAGVSMVLGAAASAMSSKPKPPGYTGASLSSISQDRTQMIRQPITNRRIIYGQVKVSGVMTMLESTDNDSIIHIVLTIAGHEVEEIGDIYFDDVLVPVGADGLVTSGPWVNNARVYKGLGTTAGDLKLIEALRTGTGSGMERGIPEKWLETHKQEGCAKIYIRWQYSQTLFSGALPQVTAIVKGKKVYDPRTTLTEYSSNSALCVADYLTSKLGWNFDWDEIDETQLTASANNCDENVNLAEGGTEKRYTCNGTIDSGEDREQTLNNLYTSCAGYGVYSSGKIYIYSAYYRAPTITYGDDDLISGLSVTSRVSRTELFNAVKGVHISTDNWQPTDFPPVTNATYLAEDSDERLWSDIELPFTTSNSAPQRIAKVLLEAARQQITVSGKFGMAGMLTTAGDVVQLTNSRMGWTDKLFECVQWKLVPATDDKGAPYMSVEMMLRETATTVYDWNSGEETIVDPAPDTNFPNPFDVAAPNGINVLDEVYVTRDGNGVKVRASATWGASANLDVVAYQLEYKLTTDSDYTVANSSFTLAYNIDDMAPGVYDFRVKAVNSIGAASDYVNTQAEIVGLSAAPGNVLNLTGTPIGGTLYMRWDLSDDIDVKVGGYIEFRHCKDIVTPTWPSSVSIGHRYPGSATLGQLPLKAGTYLAKFVDSSGIKSTTAATIVTKQSSIFSFTLDDTITESTTYPGTKVDCVAVDGVLKLAGSDAMDDWGNIDDVVDWDAEGGLVTSGTYTWDGAIDIGSVDNVRLTVTIDSDVVNSLDLIDARTDDIDDWEDFDGNSAAAGDAITYVRFTDDDPGAAPTWSEWQRLDAAEFESRAFQFKTELSTIDPAYNILISELKCEMETVN